MKPRAFLLLALLALVFSLAACGDDGDDETAQTTTVTEETSEPSDDAPAPSGDAVRAAKVEIVNFAYDPDPVEIEEGGKVIWINRDAEPHTATAEDDSFDTGDLEEGKLASETFKKPGTYRYICSIHPEMRGTVEVLPSG
jgi:plastocyanin